MNRREKDERHGVIPCGLVPLRRDELCASKERRPPNWTLERAQEFFDNQANAMPSEFNVLTVVLDGSL